MKEYLTVMAAVIAATILIPVAGLSWAGEAVQTAANRDSDIQDALVEVSALRFEESERGIQPYSSRLLVSAEYLRMDDGQDNGDYVLYDRRKRQIFSVSHHDRSILFIPHRKIEIAPAIPLELGLAKSRDTRAPFVSGLPPEHIVLSVNGQECHHVIAVAELLPEVNLALKEYHVTLAGEQAQNLFKTPVELQSPCMLAGTIFAPTRHLDHGIPILEWDYRGYRRTLIGFQESVQVESKLFQVPKGYRVFSINAVQPE